ncbi:MAG: dephospho-CoA kinase [Bacteroidetes bacterium]|nr:dephospho-CoA kinase [Bacteroidota bacterium]MBU1680058.1 dephospho-CoA kinase [Bacteroidota bacterium]MBU2505395.1 dephospho-CoA kinase [Bacteroidota bacterium]
MKKLKIALTGGIGSGKSELSKILITKKYIVLDADKIAKEILYNDADVRKKVIQKFGDDSYSEHTPNIKYLAENVFKNHARVKQINKIIHPPTTKIIERRMNEALIENDLVFVESALIFEAGLEDLFDFTILVTADDEARIKRVVKRENITEEEVLERMDHQLPQKEKKGLADFIIDNNSTLIELENKANFVLSIINSISAQ